MNKYKNDGAKGSAQLWHGAKGGTLAPCANKPATITLPITEYEKLMAIKKAACIYVREEVNWEDHGIHEEGGDEKAMEWFVNEYSEHNYG
jgi:hypothetical protein